LLLLVSLLLLLLGSRLQGGKTLKLKTLEPKWLRTRLRLGFEYMVDMTDATS
jgi:hypothetical protein